MEAVAAYFRYLAVPAPATVYRGARKLEPGCILYWNGRESRLVRYWTLKEVISQGRTSQSKVTLEQASDRLDQMVLDSVSLRMVADVPVGVFLSGGIDSSLVAAVMQKVAERPVKSFSIGFAEDSHDEARYARKIAQHLGTEHHEQLLSVHEAAELIPEVASWQEEPFADSSMVPTFLVSRFARKYVKVALSGDGGDELFCGYPRYFWARRITRIRRIMTPFGAKLLGKSLGGVPASFWNVFVHCVTRGRFAGSEGLAERVARLGRYLATPPARVYRDLISAWPEPQKLLIAGADSGALGPDPTMFPDLEWAEQMMACDQGNYLVDDILTKVDRASMRASLEAREPLLDHRLVEWSWQLPLEAKAAPGLDVGKRVMRELLCRYVPRELFDRSKQGFNMPVGGWIRGELRDWAEDLLSSKAIKEQEILDPVAIERIWKEHLSGRDHTQPLWTVLMFRAWQERWKG